MRNKITAEEISKKKFKLNRTANFKNRVIYTLATAEERRN
jgi:hypothetical protein